MRPRLNSVPSVTKDFAVLGGSVFAAGLGHRFVHQFMDAKRAFVDESREQATSTTSNILSFRRIGSRLGGASSNEAPTGTVVIDAGFFASSLSCSRMARLLSEARPDLEVIIYDRAGYGYSIRSHYAPWSFNEAALDLQAVIDQGRGEQVWIMGHSLGGYIAAILAAHEDMRDRISGLILVEPTHPQELIANSPQRVGARNIHSTMKLAPASVRLGLGWLLDSGANISSQAAPELAKNLATELKTPRIWSGAAREWKYVYPALLDGQLKTPELTVPALLIVGDDTEASRPGHRLLYDDYLTSQGSALVRIVGSTHLGLMMDEQGSSMTCSAVVEFLENVMEGAS